MEAAAVARTVNLIISTWPTGPRGHVWTDVLDELDEAPAIDAYRSLRADEERPPSVARFYAAYRLQCARRETPAVDQPVDACELCDDTGWRESTPLRAHNPRVCSPTDERPCRCHAVEPCHCSKGRRMFDVQRAVVEHNVRDRVTHGSTR